MGDLIEPPDGILREILLLVPLESLARFKCVSKSWYALITSLHTTQEPQNVLLKRIVTNEKTGKIETRFSFFFSNDVDFPCLGQEFDRSQIHGHCDGTVCLSIRPGDNIFLYNLPTGELRKLPPSILLYPREHYEYDECAEGLESVMNSVGFGYDKKSRDFKVVRVVEFGKTTTTFIETWRAEVYDLGKEDPGWREIKTPIPGSSYKMPSFDMYYQGFYYWWSVADRDTTEIIMWFDMSEEIFGHIPMPQAFDFHFWPMDSNRRSLGFLNGSMVLLHYPYPPKEDHNSFDVWRLSKDDEAGNKVLWSKLFTIGPIFGIDIPLAFVSSHELLMEDKEGRLILYNIHNQHCKHIPIKGHRSSFDRPF